MKTLLKKNGKVPMPTYRFYARIIARHKKDLYDRYGLKSIGIFGSYVRGAQHEKSDLDILVDYDVVPDLLSFINLERYLTRLLGKRVDLVRTGSIRPELKDVILSETIFL